MIKKSVLALALFSSIATLSQASQKQTEQESSPLAQPSLITAESDYIIVKSDLRGKEHQMDDDCIEGFIARIK